MKKYLLLIVLGMIFFQTTNAQTLGDIFNNYLSNGGSFSAPKDTVVKKQKSHWKLDEGFLFAPQGGLSLNKINDGFQGVFPLHLGIFAHRGSNTVLAFYTLYYNLLGIGWSHDFSKQFGMYVLTTKNTRSGQMSAFYTGVGFTTPVKKGLASAFIEGGLTWKNEPYVYTGLIIPFMKDKLEKKKK